MKLGTYKSYTKAMIKNEKQRYYPKLIPLFLSLGIIIFAPFSHAKTSETFFPTGIGDQSYKIPTFERLSELYWKIGALDIQNTTHIDNFLLINECDIYRNFQHNEFEWRHIRETSQKHIRSASKRFPNKFKSVQELGLGIYNLETKSFEIREDFKFKNIQRIELIAQDRSKTVCGVAGRNQIEGYPKSMILDLNRTINLTSLPVDADKAEELIRVKSEALPQDGRFLSEEDKLEVRDAYIVMNVKIYAYQGQERVVRGEQSALVALASLDSIEVYGDRLLTNLIYFQDFKRKKEPSPKEAEMRKKYQERLRKHREAQNEDKGEN